MMRAQTEYICICLSVKYYLSIFLYVPTRLPVKGCERLVKGCRGGVGSGKDSFGVTDFILPKKIFSWPWVQILDTLL